MKKYDGIGEVAFVMRTIDGLWVRANRPGIGLLLDLITDRMEAGAFTYRVSHENGVLVRAAPGLNAPPVKVRRERLVSFFHPPRCVAALRWVFCRVLSISTFSVCFINKGNIY